MFHHASIRVASLLAALFLCAPDALSQSSLRLHAPVYKSNKAGDLKPFKMGKKDVVTVTVRLYDDAAATAPTLDEYGQPWHEVLTYERGAGPGAPGSGLHLVPAGIHGSLDLVLGASRPLPYDIGLYGDL